VPGCGFGAVVFLPDGQAGEPLGAAVSGAADSDPPILKTRIKKARFGNRATQIKSRTFAARPRFKTFLFCYFLNSKIRNKE
jgi:hypothetical protein